MGRFTIRKPNAGPLIVALILVLLLLAALSSCRSTRYVPVETVRTDSIVRVVRDTVRIESRDDRQDSIIRRDSVIIYEYVREVVDSAGRVVRTDRERNTATVRDTEKYTTLETEYNKLEREYEMLNRAYLEKKAEPYPVERELNKWEKFKMEVGGWSSFLLIILLLFLIYRAFLR